jgi:hypothetical protein
VIIHTGICFQVSTALLNGDRGSSGNEWIVRERNLRERLVDKVPPAAGETRAEVTEVPRLSLLAEYTIPRIASPIAKNYADSLPTLLEGFIIRLPITYQERMLMGILADSGMLLSGSAE